MGLREDLVSITNRPYQPVFSARLNTPYEKKRALEKSRPQTCPKLAGTSFANTQLTSRATTAVTHKSRVKQPSASKTESIKLNETIDRVRNEIDDEFDNVSTVSTNISLFSMESSKTLVNSRSYGNFKYLSYFERYMNRRAAVKIPPNFMPK